MSSETLHAVFREILENPALILRQGITAADVDGWDSQAHINLVLGLEEAFDVVFSGEEIAAMTRVDDLLAILSKKGIKVELSP
jgi:acyl carrier protein